MMQIPRTTIPKPVWARGLTTTPIGPVTVIVTCDGLAQVAFAPEKALGQAWSALPAPDHLDQAVAQIEAYLRGECRGFTVPIDWSSRLPFERLALEAALAIPYGEVRTYGDLAQSIGRTGAARAVGGAMARNPMPLVIPCHRVVGADRRLHGYSGSGGLKTKAWLLELEGRHIVDQRVG